MQSTARWFLVLVLALDLGVAGMLLSGGSSFADTQSESPPTEALADFENSPPSPESLKALGQQMVERFEELKRREAEVEELMRSDEVLRRAALLEGGAKASQEPAAKPVPTEAEPARKKAAFQSLQKAYANMEPDSAARALAELANRDKRVVVELLLQWNPRTSGAILDSLTASDPGLSADLSYEIWKLGDGGR